MSNVLYLKPKPKPAVALLRLPDGSLAAEKDGVTHERIRLIRNFPFSFPDRFISVRTEDGEEIALLRDLTDLGESGLRLAQEELRRQYIVPSIKRILAVVKQRAEWVWQVDTDYGKCAIRMENLHEHIHPVAPGRFVLTDADGRRYLLAGVEELDPESLGLWRKMN
ncbi:protein of unknown function [Paenibacillus sp. UNC496MF]|uniref:DUF1854 domain-containing protein n=1 Tax=Paenibacillus sp. UNC496MF TaxID=1502753 RepID=UPI0008DF7F30|nr:DUF1854 domain-containing protein [Paenibacillus sp. UNC496MF]SFI88888.1 protein of unknown function [Paenibacillus sp. UNC496MF]